MHPATRSDGFQSAQEAAPCFLAYRLGAGWCACRELARLEIAAQVSGPARACTPLLGPEPGGAFTYAELRRALQLMLNIEGARAPVTELAGY